MSDGEIIVTLLSGGLTLVFAILWAVGSFTRTRLIYPPKSLWPIRWMPFVCGIVLLGVLRSLAADDVRDDARYLGMYLLLGIAWVGLARRLSPLFGLYPRQDIVERRNASAGWVYAGLLLGLTLCYAGPNIGNGPGWWVVVFSALLSTGGFFAIWLLLEAAVGLTDVVTIHRDPATGLRLAAFFVALGLILGRAAGGDWISAQATVEDFVRMGWPALALLAGELIVSLAARPTAQRPAPSLLWAGVMPAAAWIFVAAADLSTFGVGR